MSRQHHVYIYITTIMLAVGIMWIWFQIYHYTCKVPHYTSRIVSRQHHVYVHTFSIFITESAVAGEFCKDRRTYLK